MSVKQIVLQDKMQGKISVFGYAGKERSSAKYGWPNRPSQILMIASKIEIQKLFKTGKTIVFM